MGSELSAKEQMCNFTASGYVGDELPDRADALVWALTELMIDKASYYMDNLV